jgi:hypothetical protein
LRQNSGFLILSAAQDKELAKEQVDENNLPHGAFTVALTQALNQQRATTSIQNLFAGLRAILKANGFSQEPVMAGDPERFQQTLFGMEKGMLPDKQLYSVIGVQEEKVILQAGFATGINVDNELKRADDTLRIKVTKVLGINQSEAVVINGKAAKIKSGELFEVTNWVSSKAPLLKIYVPASNATYEEVQRQAAVNAQLKNSAAVKWINTFDNNEPDVFIQTANNKVFANVFTATGNIQQELKEFNTAAIEKLANGKPVFVNLMAPVQLRTALQTKFRDYKTIQLVNNPAEAHYQLYGTVDDNNRLAYGLIRLDLSLRDSLASMPLFTKTIPLSGNSAQAFAAVSDEIFETALKLSKIRGWLTLAPPQNAGFFPYHITLRNTITKKAVDSSGVKIGEPLELVIKADDNYMAKIIRQKYIYAFTIDAKGKMQLLYPEASGGSSENKFPFYKDGQPLKGIILRDDMVASDPVGTDNFFVIASDQQIPGYHQIFNQEGVRGGPGGVNHPLSDLLQMGNESKARSIDTKTPADWTLLRCSVTTRH